MILILVVSLVLCVLASAAYSGSEIGFYSLSRTRVDVEARLGRRAAPLVARLLRDDSALLITILIGNNVAIELASYLGYPVARRCGVPGPLLDVVVPLALLPFLFLFGEVLPKDLFRLRPHGLVAITAPFIAVSRVVFWPLERLLWLLSRGLERSFGLEASVVSRFRGRDEVLLGLFAEGARSGALTARAETLARNALSLRSIPISRAMVPWEQVERLELGADEEELRRLVRESRYSRLPVVDAEGAIAGYVHQLEVLGADPDDPVLATLHSLPCLPPETPVDRALRTLRGSGKRVIAVGAKEGPQGLVTLKDLVEEISGELAVW